MWHWFRDSRIANLPFYIQFGPILGNVLLSTTTWFSHFETLISSRFHEARRDRSFDQAQTGCIARASRRMPAFGEEEQRRDGDSSLSVKPGIDELRPAVLSSSWYDLAGARSAPRTDAHCCSPSLCIAVHPSSSECATSRRLLLPTFANTLYIIIVARENRAKRDLNLSTNYSRKARWEYLVSFQMWGGCDSIVWRNNQDNREKGFHA